MKRELFVAAILALAASGEASSFSRDLTGRIVGGADTTIEEHPYQISLVYVGSHRCGGAIISEYYVLTAAHCVYSLSSAYLSYLKVRVGSTLVTGGTLYDIAEYTWHSSFSDWTYENDIALVKLVLPLEFGSTIQPIELPPTDYTLPDGTLLGVSGWGRLTSGGSLPSVLQVVQVPLMNNTYCGQLYSSLSVVTDTMVCAGYEAGGKDACQGDSGGPLYYGNILVGLVSWGNGCALAYQPGVYARVSALRNWVEEKTGIQFD